MEETNILSKSGLNTADGVVNKMEYDECPVCMENNLMETLCPNNHKVCMVCAPKIRSIKNWRTNKASCPICRAEIDYVPINPVNQNHNHHVDIFAPHNHPPIQRANRQDLRHDARLQFQQNIANHTIPANAEFGGIHTRKCGHGGCNRTGGAEGVRFLIFGDTNKRRYRCELHTQ